MSTFIPTINFAFCRSLAISDSAILNVPHYHSEIVLRPISEASVLSENYNTLRVNKRTHMKHCFQLKLIGNIYSYIIKKSVASLSVLPTLKGHWTVMCLIWDGIVRVSIVLNIRIGRDCQCNAEECNISPYGT